MNRKFFIPNPDAVIVLANLMDHKDRLNLESMTRAKRAVEIFKLKNSPYLVTCGWAYRQDSHTPIAIAFKRHIVSTLDVNPKNIITELRSRDTVGDAFFTKTNLAIPKSWRHICVVTSNYHVERTREIFDFIYGPDFFINIYGAEVSYDDSTIADELSSIEIFRKTFVGINKGDNRMILERLRESHPFYNGEIYDKI